MRRWLTLVRGAFLCFVVGCGGGPGGARQDEEVAGRDAGGDAVWRPGHGPPPGKGIWIWRLEDTGMTAPELAEAAATLGIGYVLIKAGEDGAFWADRYGPAEVAALAARGIAVLAWLYDTPVDVAGDVAAALAAAAVPGTGGVVIDAECEWEGGACCGISDGCAADYSTAAAALCGDVHAARPDLFLGYTSFGWVGDHPAFPFAAFDGGCGDGFFPQVYWSDRGVAWNGPEGIGQAEAMIASAGLVAAPIWWVQSNDDGPTGTAPETTDLDGFFRAAGAYASLWLWPPATEPAKQAQLRALRWTN